MFGLFLNLVVVGQMKMYALLTLYLVIRQTKKQGIRNFQFLFRLLTLEI